MRRFLAAVAAQHLALSVLLYGTALYGMVTR